MQRPTLYQVVPTDDFKVYLYYDNGEIKVYNCDFILTEGSAYDKIKNIENFKGLCTIMGKTLAFDISEVRDPYTCIDFCPDLLYQDSTKAEKDILSA